jgi:hypothetical protein
MARLKPTGSGVLSVVDTSAAPGGANGSGFVYFLGLEIVQTDAGSGGTIVQIGAGQQAAGDQPHDITFDRCWVHGRDVALDSVVVQHGIEFEGKNLALIHSAVTGIVNQSIDCQAIFSCYSFGPLLIWNNDLEAMTENILFGGCVSHGEGPPNIWPQDVTILQNRILKPLRWFKLGNNYIFPNVGGFNPSVKNGIECKSCRRVLEEGNLLLNDWRQGQLGEPFILDALLQRSTDITTNLASIQRTSNVVTVVVNQTTPTGITANNSFASATGWVDGDCANTNGSTLNNGNTPRIVSTVVYGGSTITVTYPDTGGDTGTCTRSAGAVRFAPCGWCTITDVTIRNNLSIHSGQFIQFGTAGSGAGDYPAPMVRFSIHDNLLEDVSQNWNFNYSGSWKSTQMTVSKSPAVMDKIAFDHNTIMQSDPTQSISDWGWGGGAGSQGAITNYSLTNSIFTWGASATYGFVSGGGAAQGCPTFNTYPDSLIRGIAFIGSFPSAQTASYTSAATCAAMTTRAIDCTTYLWNGPCGTGYTNYNLGFSDFDRGIFSLAPTSPARGAGCTLSTATTPPSCTDSATVNLGANYQQVVNKLAASDGSLVTSGAWSRTIPTGGSTF